ncbi:hypothetical protein E6Q11_05150 [Candidatus Dojkabacteria bacterium]|uniref:Uncharacterized protein n=1 Tax=Candidatus Dojkabacteria bacterium TaxID=2099670 RepID=A0A5C7J461_9BACT|nr:MAG: hypothetical protein E6Q11_05150 [Candidatus Dojkabacteria bacterium]
MKMESEKCRECGGVAMQGKAVVNFHNVRVAGAGEFYDRIVDCLKCCDCGHSWVPTKSESDRQTAIKWFNAKSTDEALRLVERHLPHRPFRGIEFLSGREIEIIWRKENPEPLNESDKNSMELAELIHNKTCCFNHHINQCPWDSVRHAYLTKARDMLKVTDFTTAMNVIRLI